MKFFADEKYIGPSVYTTILRAKEQDRKKDIEILNCFNYRLPVISATDWEQYCIEYAAALSLSVHYTKEREAGHKRFLTIELDLLGVHSFIVMPKPFANAVARYRHPIGA